MMIQSRIEDRRRRVTISTLIIHDSSVLDSDCDQDSMKYSLISLMNGMIFIYLFLFLNYSEWLKRGFQMVLFTKIKKSLLKLVLNVYTKKLKLTFSTQKDRMPS